ncbi:MAG TPA: PAS domain-containing protein, partial [Polyangiales bacterium]
MHSPLRELSEAQVRQILLDVDLWSQLSDIVSLISRDLRFLYISRTVNGRDKAEVLGSSVLDHISPNMREPFREHFMRAWQSGEPVTAEGSTDDGQYWYENQLYLVRHPELEPVMFCATRDITARKQAER